jgi:hypothetical protein
MEAFSLLPWLKHTQMAPPILKLKMLLLWKGADTVDGVQKAPPNIFGIAALQEHVNSRFGLLIT